MAARDRLVLIAIAMLVLLAGGWYMLVSPERQQASKLEAQVTTASAQLTSAEGELSSARGAATRYSNAYSSIVNLGKAVPATAEVPSLIFQLEQASNLKRVDFSSIVTGTGSGSSPSSATPAAVTSGFSQMPFTFVFNGNFFDLYNLFQQLNGFTQRTASGQLQIRGRLLTIQSVKLAPVTTGTASAPGSHSQLTGTITATAYVLPAGQGLTGGAIPAAPGASGTSASPSSPTTPAIIR
jgi:Tfp pilus assembly protein PilO